MIKKVILTLLLIALTCSTPLHVLAAEPAKTDTTMLDGASITMLQNQTRTQISSFLIKTKAGKIIIVDGGLREDAKYLANRITEQGGTVTAWFLTHPHKDHVGALGEILTNDDYKNIIIEDIYYSFPTVSWVYQKESANISDLLTINQALEKVPDAQKHTNLLKGDQIQIDDVTVSILTQWNPDIMLDAVNNSSVLYSMEINSKKILFLGDLGHEGSKALLAQYTADELKHDIVQMSHHGQDTGTDLYSAIRPEICMWPTPSWLWFNNNGGGRNSGSWTTPATRKKLLGIGVKSHLVSKDGDQTVY